MYNLNLNVTKFLCNNDSNKNRITWSQRLRLFSINSIIELINLRFFLILSKSNHDSSMRMIIVLLKVSGIFFILAKSFDYTWFRINTQTTQLCVKTARRLTINIIFITEMCQLVSFWRKIVHQSSSNPINSYKNCKRFRLRYCFHLI